MAGRSINTGNNEFLKRYNRACILDLVRIHGPISRMRLSEMSGLSPTATGSIVSTLLEKGYLHEVGTGESSGGRKPVLLELKPGTYFSIGMDVDGSRILVILLDINGTATEEYTFKTDGMAKDPAGVFNIMENAVSSMLERHKIDRKHLLGIGVSIPGLIGLDSNEIVFAPNLGWKNVGTSRFFSSFSGIPVHVENESKASAICENWLGECTNINDFICINIGSGIGAGIFTSGKLYRGHSGTAGEVGHMTVDENGPLCGCGKRGCLEAFASTSRLLERAEMQMGLKSGSLTLDTLVDMAEKGDNEMLRLLYESSGYLGQAISYLVNMLNPGKIVIGRDFTRYAHLVIDNIMRSIQTRSLEAPASRVQITASRLGDRSSAMGAAIIPLKVLFGRN
jgi:N-acetylglucosamine repressor